MKKLFMTLCMLVAAVAFFGASVNAETVAVKKVIQVPGATKEQLFQKVRTWSERYGQSYSTDAKSGVIMVNGEIAYPSPPIDRIQYAFPFKMKNNIQNNIVTVTFDDVMLKAPKSYLPESVGAATPFIGGEVGPVKSKKDVTVVTNSLNLIATNLESFLLNKTGTATLMRCPDCGVLCTSPEQMKEHMKVHEHMKGHPEH